MFGGKTREALAQAQQENAYLRAELQRLGAMDVVQIRNELASVTDQIRQQRHQFEQERAAFATQYAQQQNQLRAIAAEIVQTDDAKAAQEVGVYHYRHVLADAEAYKARLDQIKQQIADMVKNKTAATGSQSFTFNNSLAKGRKFVGDLSKLMLRGYNAEADICVRVLKAGNLESAIKRLETSVRVIQRLGAMADIKISPAYHHLRVQELELTADYLAKKQEEKEAEREHKARLREERIAMKEYQEAHDRLAKEHLHYQNAIEALRAKGDLAGLAKLEAKLAEIEQALRGVEERQANIRAGYVYVISNIGSFGDGVVKIGMTRRLEPMDRVRELGDASVPFRFDVHALFFSHDAVGIETELHRRLADRRLNKVNLRREFFRVTPAEVKAQLLQLSGNILDYNDDAEALEYRQSMVTS
jgi:hypothetical protein